MPKITKPLSDTEIKKAKRETKTYKLSDGKGLFLVVKENGTKFFRFDYSFENKRKSMSFGVYPETSLSLARELREKARTDIKLGIDPIRSKNDTSSDNNTFGHIAGLWLDTMRTKWVNSTYAKTENVIRNHTHEIHNTDISKITRRQILGLINKVQNKGLLETASRLLNNIERIFKYAVTYNLTEHNIVADIDKKNALKSSAKNHFAAIVKPDEIKQLIYDIKHYEQNFKADASTVLAFNLAPYIFLRPYNLRFLEWREVDLDNETIEIPGEKMKTRKDFIIPLSRQAIEILKLAKLVSFHKSIFVFPSPITNSKPISDNTLNHALKRLGYKDRMVPHGFRAMFSTIAHEKISEHGYNSDIIESCLAHSEQNQVKAAYNRENKMKYFTERKHLMQWWADWLDFQTNT